MILIRKLKIKSERLIRSESGYYLRLLLSASNNFRLTVQGAFKPSLSVIEIFVTNSEELLDATLVKGKLVAQDSISAILAGNYGLVQPFYLAEEQRDIELKFRQSRPERGDEHLFPHSACTAFLLALFKSAQDWKDPPRAKTSMLNLRKELLRSVDHKDYNTHLPPSAYITEQMHKVTMKVQGTVDNPAVERPNTYTEAMYPLVSKDNKHQSRILSTDAKIKGFLPVEKKLHGAVGPEWPFYIPTIKGKEKPISDTDLFNVIKGFQPPKKLELPMDTVRDMLYVLRTNTVLLSREEWDATGVARLIGNAYEENRPLTEQEFRMFQSLLNDRCRDIERHAGNVLTVMANLQLSQRDAVIKALKQPLKDLPQIEPLDFDILKVSALFGKKIFGAANDSKFASIARKRRAQQDARDEAAKNATRQAYTKKSYGKPFHPDNFTPRRSPRKSNPPSHYTVKKKQVVQDKVDTGKAVVVTEAAEVDTEVNMVKAQTGLKVVKEIEVGHLQAPPLTRSDHQKLALGTAPVGAALTACIHKWEQISTPTTILAIIRQGYLLPFIKGKFPPVTQNPQEYKIGQEEQVAVELLKLQEKEAIEEVLPPYGPGFYNLLFVVPKQPEGWRPVLNVRALNEYVTKVNFKMETSNTVQVALADAKWAVTLDLKDAFFHIPMHPKARPFLRFMSQNKVWQFKVPPFGLTVAPFLFTWVMRPVVKELRRQGIRVHIYLDDMIIFHTDEITLRHHRDTALTLLQELGFHINWGKSQLVPVSTIVYLGMEFTLKSSLVRPPMDKCLEIKELAQKFMDNAYMTARQWSILLGKLAFLATMVPQGRLHQRELQFHLRQHWDFNWDLQTTVQIPMTESVQQTLSWWTHIPNLRVGKPLSQPSPSRTIFTDASLEGWGGHMGSHMASGL